MRHLLLRDHQESRTRRQRRGASQQQFVAFRPVSQEVHSGGAFGRDMEQAKILLIGCSSAQHSAAQL